MIYLYIPFYENENNKKLLKLAELWYHEVYEDKKIPCRILSPENLVNISLLNDARIKIYVLGYERASHYEISSSPQSQNSIDMDELVHRILKLGLPTQRPVELKLCLKCEKEESSQFITNEFMKYCFRRLDYNNPELVLRIQYSHEPFPGEETKKLAYRHITGAFNFFEEAANKTDQGASLRPTALAEKIQLFSVSGFL